VFKKSLNLFLSIKPTQIIVPQDLRFMNAEMKILYDLRIDESSIQKHIIPEAKQSKSPKHYLKLKNLIKRKSTVEKLVM
jgi:hypothetical protein